MLGWSCNSSSSIIKMVPHDGQHEQTRVAAAQPDGAAPKELDTAGVDSVAIRSPCVSRAMATAATAIRMKSARRHRAIARRTVGVGPRPQVGIQNSAISSWPRAAYDRQQTRGGPPAAALILAREFGVAIPWHVIMGEASLPLQSHVFAMSHEPINMPSHGRHLPRKRL
jgi:hypothetical protein